MQRTLPCCTVSATGVMEGKRKLCKCHSSVFFFFFFPHSVFSSFSVFLFPIKLFNIFLARVHFLRVSLMGLFPHNNWLLTKTLFFPAALIRELILVPRLDNKLTGTLIRIKINLSASKDRKCCVIPRFHFLWGQLLSVKIR